MNAQAILQQAKSHAYREALKVLKTDTSGSNGSEAWQAVVIDVDGRSRIAKDLKAVGVEKDYYWGFTVSPERLNNYFAEELWTKEVAKWLNANGIKARRVERLL